MGVEQKVQVKDPPKPTENQPPRPPKKDEKVVQQAQVPSDKGKSKSVDYGESGPWWSN